MPDGLVAEKFDALAGAPFMRELAAEAEVLRGEGVEFGVGWALFASAILAPACEGGLDVAGEDLDLVVDAG